MVRAGETGNNNHKQGSAVLECSSREAVNTALSSKENDAHRALFFAPIPRVEEPLRGDPVWSRLRSCVFPVLDVCIDAYYVSLTRKFRPLDLLHHMAAIRHLVAEGADVHGAEDASGGHCLHYAAGSGSEELCQVLLTAKASPLTQDRQCETPLWWAIAGGHSKACELLLKCGEAAATMTARRPVRNKRAVFERPTPLHEAASFGYMSIVRALLPFYHRLGPDVREKCLQLRTPLHLAAAHGHLEVVAALLGSAADPLLPCALGRTALHHAVIRGEESSELCRMLVAHGTGALRLRDVSGRSPTELAAHLAVLTPELRAALEPPGAARRRAGQSCGAPSARPGAGLRAGHRARSLRASRTAQRGRSHGRPGPRSLECMFAEILSRDEC